MSLASLQLGPFRLVDRLGQGGMGEVWRATSPDGEAVAVKVLTAERARDRRFVGSFREEARAVARLDHPGIIGIHDHGEVSAAAAAASAGQLTEGAPWLAMELMPGGTLGAHPPGDWAALREVLLRLLDALAHAHARDLVHRDLKPANVLLAADGGLRLSDFGAAHDQGLLGDEARDAVFGTLAYMPPEQAAGRTREQGPWTDLYALGALGWRLATGAPVFEGGARDILHQHRLVPPPAFRPALAVPEGFEAWLRTLLEKEPRRRYRRAADAAWALVQLGEPVAADPGLLAAAPPAATVLTALPTWDTDRTHTLHHAASVGRAAVDPAGDSGPVVVVPHGRPPLPETWRVATEGAPTAVLSGAGMGLFGLRTVPLVGREAERDALWAAFGEAAAASRVEVALVTGGPGEGKSRLAEWIGARLHEVGAATVLRARHGPSGAGPGEGLVGMVARHMAATGLRGEALQAQLAWAFPGAPEPTEVRALAGLIDPDPAGGRRGPEERRSVLRRLLARLAEERPVVLIADDLQWAPEAARLVEELVERWGEAGPPILVLALARLEPDLPDGPLGRLATRPGVRHLPLDRLPPEHTRALVQGLLGLSPELAARVAQRADGNPLFAVQLVGDWVARDVLEPRPEGWRLRPGAEAPLPDDIHALWSTRLGRLSSALGPDDPVALEVAAVLGRAFAPVEWLAACAEAGLAPSRDLLDALVRAGLAERQTTDGVGSVRLAHGMLAESLLRRAAEGGRLAALHAAAARSLAARHPGSGPHARRIGLHAQAASLHDLAVGALFDALVHSFRIGELLQELEELHARREASLDALGASDSDPRRLEGEALRTEILYVFDDARQAVAHGRRVLARARAAGHLGPLASALTSTGNALRATGELAQAKALLAEAVEVADRAGLDAAGTTARRVLADLKLTSGELDEAWALAAEVARRAEAADDPYTAASIHVMQGRICQLRGELEQAEGYASRAQAEHHRTGHLMHEAVAWTMLGEVLRARGDLAAAAEAYRRSGACFVAVGSGADLISGLNLAMVEVLQGRDAAALAAATAVLDRALPLERDLAAGFARAVRLPGWARTGAWAALDADLDAIRALVDRGLVDPDVATCARLAAEAALSAGQRPRALALVALARDQWTRMGRSQELAALDALVGVPAG